jgi:hypothetical protein
VHLIAAQPTAGTELADPGLDLALQRLKPGELVHPSGQLLKVGDDQRAHRVHPLSEVRQRLSGILARFRQEGAAAEPVAFGSHRKPEAILLSYEVYERYEALSRQRARLDSALASAQSVQAELPGPFSPDHDREVAAYVDGEISAAELYRRTVARYRQP